MDRPPRIADANRPAVTKTTTPVVGDAITSLTAANARTTDPATIAGTNHTGRPFDLARG